jgi:hypothetical protein
MYVLAVGTQIYNRVADQLPQPVISCLAAPVCLEEGDAARRQSLRCGEDGGGSGASSERQDVRVFDEQERVRARAVFARGLDLLLDKVGRAVLHPPEAANL